MYLYATFQPQDRPRPKKTDMKRLLIPLFCLFAHPAWAETPVPAPPPTPATITPEERQQLLGRAEALKAESSKMLDAAEKKQKEAEPACWKKTLVSACLNDARKEYIDSRAAARKLSVEAKRIEREVRERDRATKQARQAEEAPIKQAETEKRIAREKEKAAEQQTKREEEAAARKDKAEAGSARSREEARKRQEKLEARRKKEEKAEQKALEREKKDKKRAEERARQLEHAQQQER